MALVNCPDCSNQISDQANACPKCGHPIKPTNNVYITNAKKGKSKKLIGLILIILSLFAGKSFGFIFLIGIILLVSGKIENWWHWK